AWGHGTFPVVLARICIVADRRPRHRRLFKYADDFDSHRSATGDAIARNGDRDHVHRHRAGRCDDDRHPIGTSWTSGSGPDYGCPRTLWIEPSLEETDQGAGRRIATSLTLLWVIRGKVTPEIRAHSASAVGAAKPCPERSHPRGCCPARKRDYPGRSYSLIKSVIKNNCSRPPRQNATPSVNRFSALLFSTDTAVVHRH